MLQSVPVPAGLTLAAGGSRHRRLDFAAPPRIALTTDDPAAILDMLRYAGVRYAAPDSPAAAAGLRVFAAGRALARYGAYDAVTFDWDHTLSNYQLFEDLPRLAAVRARKSPPSAAISAALMVGIEFSRPFMIELAFGMMAGFAARQGLARLSDWERYRPQVGVATHTWPDRLATLATHYMPILPLMEGMLPGAPDVYERFMSADVRSAIHLHHFLNYATALVRSFAAQGFSVLPPAQQYELMQYLEDGTAHRRKPLSAWAGCGWTPMRLLHIDDSTTVVADLRRQSALAGHAEARALYVPHPHSTIFGNIQEWHKIYLPALWRKRQDAIRGAATNLVRKEWSRSAVPDLLRRLGHPSDANRIAWPESALPAGTVMTLHETPTTLGELWDYFVEPVTQAQSLIRKVRRCRGGLRAIRRAYRDARSLEPEGDIAHAPRQKEFV